MSRVHSVRSGTCYASRDGLRPMTDAEYADTVDNSPPIGEAYASLGRVGSPMYAACMYGAVHGIKSRIGGPTKGDAPAVCEYRKR